MSLQLLKSISKLSHHKTWFRQLHYRSALFSETATVANESKKKTETLIATEEHKNRGLTKDNPVVVASYFEKIIVGCQCSSDSPALKWFYLEEGNPQVCDCGYYFKLDLVEKGKWIPEYSYIMQVDPDAQDPRRGRNVKKRYSVNENNPKSKPLPQVNIFDRKKLKT